MSSRPLREGVAAEVRAELGRQRWSIQELAAATGIPVATMRRRIHGATPFNLDEIDRIAAALTVPPLQFFAGSAVPA